MSSDTSQQFESYVPVYDVIPDKWEDARVFLVEQLKKISNAVNIREIGWLLDEELLSGQQFFPGTTSANNQQFRSVLRKIIDFGALPNAGTKSVAHNINVDANFSILELYAGASNPTGSNYLQIPYSSGTLNKNIELFMDATNVTIITSIDYSAWTRCFVVATYIQEL